MPKTFGQIVSSFVQCLLGWKQKVEEEQAAESEDEE